MWETDSVRRPGEVDRSPDEATQTLFGPVFLVGNALKRRRPPPIRKAVFRAL